MSEIYICPNCETQNAYDAKFCVEGSQKTHLKLKSVWRMMFDFFANLIDYDSKLFSSIKGLFQPGFLTNQYLMQKRVRYLTPIRMFIIAMLSFFWILSQNGLDNDLFKFSNDSNVTISNSDKANQNNDKYFTLLEKYSAGMRFDSLFKRLYHEFEVSKLKQLKSIKKLKKQIEKLEKNPASKPEKIQKTKDMLKAVEALLEKIETGVATTQKTQQSLNIDKSKTSNVRLIYKEYKFNIYDLSNLPTEELIEKYKIENWLEKLLVGKFQKFNQDPKAFGKFVFQNLTWVVLIEILLMSLFFKLFYFRSKKKYVEHFIFHLNIRSWLFVVGSLLFLFADFINNQWIILTIVLSVITYLFFSLKRVYQQGYLMTTLKLATLTFIEMIVLLIAFLVVLLVSSLLF